MLRRSLVLAIFGEAFCRGKRLLQTHEPMAEGGDKNSCFAQVESVMLGRRSCRRYDQNRKVPDEVLERIMAATVRSPSALNLQPWVAITVTSPDQRGQLCHAALSQESVAQAPLTVVFAATTRLTDAAPQIMEMGLSTKHMSTQYASSYLRKVNLMLNPGPCSAGAYLKSALASVVRLTGRPVPSPPCCMFGYAVKQAMIPATNFVTLCVAAGLSTCFLEGFDEEAVKKVVDLPEHFAIACLVTVGYPGKDGDAFAPVPSPRFPRTHFFRGGSFVVKPAEPASKNP